MLVGHVTTSSPARILCRLELSVLTLEAEWRARKSVGVKATGSGRFQSSYIICIKPHLLISRESRLVSASGIQNVVAC